MPDLAVRVGGRGRSPIVSFPPVATGWRNITPAGTTLTLDYGASGHPVKHPNYPNKIYLGYDQDGIYESIDYGLENTYTKVSGSSNIGEGAIWFLRMSPDGAAMYGGHGHDTTGGRHQKINKSIDDARSWFEGSADLGFEPYDLDFDPSNPSRAIATSHNSGDSNVYLSENMHLNNGAITFISIGATGAGNSGYAIFGLTASTVLWFAEDDDGGVGATKRNTWNGSAWSGWSNVGTYGHWHGSFDPYVDRVNGIIYVATAAGIVTSDDDGLTWEPLLDGDDLASVHVRGNVIIAGLSYALPFGSEWGPNLRLSTNGGSSFSSPSKPTGMDNGPRAWCSVVRGSQVIFICNCWASGSFAFVMDL